MKNYENEKGNITMVIILILVVIMVLTILSQILLQNKITEKTIVTNTFDTTYSLESSISFIKSSVVEMIEHKEIYWQLGVMGEEIFVNVDYYENLIGLEDMTKVLSSSNEYSYLYLKNTPIYIENLKSDQVIDNCYEDEENDTLICQGTTDFVFNAIIQHEKNIVRFEIYVEGIEVKTDPNQMKIYLDNKNLEIIIKKVGG